MKKVLMSVLALLIVTGCSSSGDAKKEHDNKIAVNDKKKIQIQVRKKKMRKRVKIKRQKMKSRTMKMMYQ